MLPTPDDLAALHRAAVDGSLELLFQPEIDLATGGIVAMEGLLRWHHRDLGLLVPTDFLGLAESSGEINSIGAWVLREGAATAARWSRLPGPQRRLWLNVSATQLTAPGFVDLVAEVVAEHDLPRHPLEAQGYLSVGCEPCTSKVAPGEDPRAGRWRGWDKTECGIHTPDQPADHFAATRADDNAAAEERPGL